MSKAHALANVAPKDIFARVLAEESTQSIAASYGISRSHLSHWLIEHSDADWKKTQVIRALNKKERAEDVLEAAMLADSKITHGQLTGARELLRSALAELAVLWRPMYGPQMDIQVQVSIADAMTAALARRGSDAPNVIDAQIISESRSDVHVGPDCQSVAALPPPHALDIFGE